MTIKRRIILIVLSFYACINATAIPIFNSNNTGGLLPESYMTFEEVIDACSMYIYLEVGPDYWFRSPIIIFTICVFIFSVLSFIGAILGKNGMVRAVSYFGLLILYMLLAMYLLLSTGRDENAFSYMFDIETGRIAVGMWAAIGLFHVMGHLSKTQKIENSKNPQITVGLRDRISKLNEEKFIENNEE